MSATPTSHDEDDEDHEGDQIHAASTCAPEAFHLVVQPKTPEALSAFMLLFLTADVRRYHKHYRSHGHVWQGRFKSSPIQQDEHLLTVLGISFAIPYAPA